MTSTESGSTPTEGVSWPKILRLKAALESVRSEIDNLTPDARALERLAAMHNSIQSELGDAVGEDLEVELVEFSSCCYDNPDPSKDEIRVAQAQLAGWIQGLLNGVVLSEAQARSYSQQAAPAAAQDPETRTYNPRGYV